MRQPCETPRRQRLSVGVTRQVAQVIERLAEEQGRSVSSYLSHVVVAHLQSAGHLPRPNAS